MGGNITYIIKLFLPWTWLWTKHRTAIFRLDLVRVDVTLCLGRGTQQMTAATFPAELPSRPPQVRRPKSSLPLPPCSWGFCTPPPHFCSRFTSLSHPPPPIKLILIFYSTLPFTFLLLLQPFGCDRGDRPLVCSLLYSGTLPSVPLCLVLCSLAENRCVFLCFAWVEQGWGWRSTDALRTCELLRIEAGCFISLPQTKCSSKTGTGFTSLFLAALQGLSTQ